MTVRLSAMFEEHMKRLIYNWKTAKRRSRPRRGRILDNNRKKGKIPSTSEEEDDDDDDEDDSSPIRTTNPVSRSVTSANKSQKSNSSQNSGTFKNCNGGIKRKLASQTYLNGNKSSSSPNDSNNTDDSDYAPLSKWRKTNYKEQTSTNRKKICDTSSSDSEVIVKTMTTRNSKRPRYVNDDESDEDSVSEEEDRSYTSCSDDDNPIVTVSSRGRIRKMTPRARALLKK